MIAPRHAPVAEIIVAALEVPHAGVLEGGHDDLLGGPGALLACGSQPWVTDREPDPVARLAHRHLRHLAPGGEQAAPDPFEGGQVGRLLSDGLGDQRVVRVADDDRLLGREVPEERHVREARGVGDLGDSRRVVAALEEEP